MSLSQQYRHQFAAQRNSQLLFCLATAMTLHVGAIALGLMLWRNQSVAATVPQPIEFIALTRLDPPQIPPVISDVKAPVDAVAGGEQQLGAIATGKPTATKAIPVLPPTPAKSADGKPMVEAAKADMAQAPMPSTELGAIAKETPKEAVNRASPTSARIAALPPSDSPLSESSPPNSAPTLPLDAVAPLPNRSQPTVPVSPSLSSELETQPERPTPIAERPPSEPAAPVKQPPSLHQLLADLGRGLDELLNPNRTADAPASVDAQQDKVWGDYLTTVNQKIEQKWQRIAVDRARDCKVRFVIDRQGQLVSWELARPSGNSAADQAALQAVQDAAPFQPLPAQTTENQLVVGFTFTYRANPAEGAGPL